MKKFVEALEAMQIFDVNRLLEMWSEMEIKVKNPGSLCRQLKGSAPMGKFTVKNLLTLLNMNKTSVDQFCKLVPKYFSDVYGPDKQIKFENKISYYYIYGSTDEENGCTLKEFKDMKFYVIAEDYGGNELLFSLKNKTFHDYFHESWFHSCMENNCSYEEVLAFSAKNLNALENYTIGNESWGIKNTSYWGSQEARPKGGFRKLEQLLGLTANIPLASEAHWLFNQMYKDHVDVNKFTRIVPACFESCYKDVKGKYTSYLLAGDDEENGITEEEFGKMKFYEIAVDGWGNSLLYSCKTKMFYEYIHDDGLFFRSCLDTSIPYEQFINSFNR